MLIYQFCLNNQGYFCIQTRLWTDSVRSHTNASLDQLNLAHQMHKSSRSPGNSGEVLPGACSSKGAVRHRKGMKCLGPACLLQFLLPTLQKEGSFPTISGRLQKPRKGPVICMRDQSSPSGKEQCNSGNHMVNTK